LITSQFLLENISKAYQSQLPFVAFRKPNDKIVKAIFQKDVALHYVKDYKESGFVFAPFEAEKSAVLLMADSMLEAEVSDFKFDKGNLRERHVYSEGALEKEKHIDFVNETISFLKKEAVSKIVIARSKKIACLKFDFLDVFQKLMDSYLLANVYVWYHPKVGMWMGATPETLLEIKGNDFKTMALAGTQPYVNSLDVVWGEKELEEQQMVTDYVLSNLKKTTETLQKSDVYTAKAGALLHLRTDISGRIKVNSLRGNSSSELNNGLANMLKALHPTPAVCGFPREKSKKYILENENFSRSFYTGFLGELNLDKQTTLFVNLRCMEVISKNEVQLYVGGGITEKSDAEKEWEETVSKCKTMERVL